MNAQHLELKARGISLGFLEKKHSEASFLSQPDFSSLIQLTRSVQLWPVMEYLAMLWQYKVTADFMTQACLRRWAILQVFFLWGSLFSWKVILCILHLKQSTALSWWGVVAEAEGGHLPLWKARNSWFFACFVCVPSPLPWQFSNSAWKAHSSLSPPLYFLSRSSKQQQPQIVEEISRHITFCLKHTPVAPQELRDFWSLVHHQKVKIKVKIKKPPLCCELIRFSVAHWLQNIAE